MSTCAAHRVGKALAISFEGSVSGEEGKKLRNWFVVTRRPILLTLDADGGDLLLCREIQEAMKVAVGNGAPCVVLVKRAVGPASLIAAAGWYRFALPDSQIGPLHDKRIRRAMLKTLLKEKLPKWAFKRLRESRLTVGAAHGCYWIDRIFPSQRAAEWHLSELAF